MKPVTTNEGRAPGVWAIADFRRLWRSSAVSRVGSEIGELALPLLAIITLKASPTEVGLLRSAHLLPFLLVTLPLGVLVDRKAKRLLMISADVGRFVLVSLVPVLVWGGVETIEVLYGLVFGAGCLTVLYQLADFAYLPFVVPEDRVVEANGKLFATASAGEIAGRGLGGLIVDVLTAPIALLVDAFTFLLSAMSLSRIAGRESPPGHEKRASALREAWDGLVTAARSRIIRPLMIEAAVFNLFEEIFILGLLVHSVRGIGMSPAQVGLVFVAGGAGAASGSWSGPGLAARFGYGRVLLVALMLGNSAPLAVIAAGSSPGRAAMMLMAIFGVMGFGIGVANVHAVSLRQLAVHPSRRSRVNAGYRLISWGAVPLGAALGGLLATRFGAFPATLLGAVGLASATLPVALSSIPRMRNLTDVGTAA